MKRYFSILFIVITNLYQSYLWAQGESNVWTFGHKNGLNFNTNPPSFFQSNNLSMEGAASVSDVAGNLLFYSDGRTVWEAGGNVMQNGNGIMGNGPAIPIGFGIIGSSAQGVAIVKSLANAQQYYLFTLDAGEDLTPSYTGYLRYSVIDMSLNGGAGAVVANQKNIVLDDHMSEEMTVVKGAGCYYWIICHKNNSAAYRVFKLDDTGLQPPVTSTVGSSDIQSHLSVSFAGDRILHQGTNGDGFEIGTFNNTNGTVSNIISVNYGQQFALLGSCFSPNDQKVYLASWFGGMLQYDVTAYPNAAAISATKVVLTTEQFCDPRNGPDGKIYVSSPSIPFIGIIENPNNSGLACNFNPAGLAQPAWADWGLFPQEAFYGNGLGENTVTVNASDTETYVTDTLICQSDTFRISGPIGYADFLWSTGSTENSMDVTTDGYYWVLSRDGCRQRADTFKVDIVTFGKHLGPDTFLCPDGELTLDMTVENGAYLWNNGSDEPTLQVIGPGRYHVIVQKENCIRNDTINITEISPSLSIIAEDSVLCLGTKIELLARSTPQGSYLWNTGVPDSILTIGDAGEYSVTVNNACGAFKESITISASTCDCSVFIPTAFSPNGDGRNDHFAPHVACSPKDYRFSIYNRYGSRVFSGTHPGDGWDGTYMGKTVDVGVYFYSIQFASPSGVDIEENGDVTLIR